MENNKNIKISKVKLFTATLILALIVFVIYNIIWFNYISIYDKLLNNETLQEIKIKPSSAPDFIVRNGVEIPYSYERYAYIESERYTAHQFHDYDYNERGYFYGIVIPSYLRFAGNIQIAYFADDYSLNLMINPRKWLYVLGLGEHIGNQTNMLGSIVDKDGQPLGKNPNDSEEFYQEWLELYEKYYEQIMDLFAVTKEMFGDVLK